MDGKGGCCIARYAGGGHDMSKVDRIMLRFRPIAPKPAAGGSVSGGSSPPENNEAYGRAGRGKRRYTRDNARRCNRKRRTSLDDKKEALIGETGVVTLPLLPETPVGKDSPTDLDLTTAKQVKNLPMWLNFSSPVNSDDININHHHQADGLGASSDRTVVMMPQPVRVVGSCVTVECVTDTWVEGGTLGSTDEERRRNLERDTCPGFISDGWNRVGWTNRAYRRMVAGQPEEERRGGSGVEEQGKVVVWVVMKESVPWTCAAFTCRVRLQYTCGKERSSLTLPCDVWRMDGGGLAWRLDVNAALSLGSVKDLHPN